MQNQTQIHKQLETGLVDIYHAENQIYEGLETMIKEASSSDLKTAFKKHHKETENQIKRLEKIGQILEFDIDKSRIAEKEGLLEKGKEVAKTILTMNPKSSNKMMEGLISQGKETLSYLTDNKRGSDLSTASGAQLIEEFEIISYQVLHAIAKREGLSEVATLLLESLHEEEHAWAAMKKFFDENIEKIER